MGRMETKETEEYFKIALLFKDLLLQHFGERLISVALYGSVARGAATAESDIDVLIVARDLPQSYHQRVKMIRPIVYQVEESAIYQAVAQEGFGPDLRFLIFSPEEAKKTRPLYLDMVEEARILYDTGLLQAKFEELRKRMAELGSRRVFLPDGSWYWELKPDLKPGEVFEL